MGLGVCIQPALFFVAADFNRILLLKSMTLFV